MRRIVIVSVSSTLLVAAIAVCLLVLRARTQTDIEQSSTPAGSRFLVSNGESSSASGIPLNLNETDTTRPSSTPDPTGLRVTDNNGTTSASQAAVPIAGTSPNSNSTSGDPIYHEPSLSELANYGQYEKSPTPMFGELIIGTGEVAVAGKRVAVYYKGWLTNGTLFDRSQPGKPFIFNPGEHKVIPGWESDIVGMRVGGKRRFIIPSAWGYKDQQVANIPPGSLLVFDVELLEVEK